MTFIDLTKAFDSVNRDRLWRIMEKFGCTHKFINIVRQFHEGMTARVLNDGELSEAFHVTNGVKQGCVLAPTLFSMMYAAMLSDAFMNSDDGVHIQYRTDGRLFNLRRLNAFTKIKKSSILDLLFADDCAIATSSEEDMQISIDKFSNSCDSFGLSINTRKTEVMMQPAPNGHYPDPVIKIKNQSLQVVDSFTYLGSTLSKTVAIDYEVNNRIAKASAAFGRLRNNVWDRKGISLATKIKVYQAIVLTTLLYASETWTVYSRHARKLNHFHTCCLRRLIRVKWQDKVPDSEVLTRAKLPSIYTLLKKAQVRWAGHVVRMSDKRIPKQLLYSQLSTGKRPAGGQRKRYKDSLKVSLKSFNIDITDWENLAQDRSTWRSKITRGARTAELRHTADAQRKRAARKDRTTNTHMSNADYMCPTCGRGFCARIGLYSHLRTHQRGATTHI